MDRLCLNTRKSWLRSSHGFCGHARGRRPASRARDTAGVAPGHVSGGHSHAVKPLPEDVFENTFRNFSRLSPAARRGGFPRKRRQLDGIEPFQPDSRRRFIEMPGRLTTMKHTLCATSSHRRHVCTSANASAPMMKNSSSAGAIRACIFSMYGWSSCAGCLFQAGNLETRFPWQPTRHAYARRTGVGDAGLVGRMGSRHEEHASN